MNGHDFQPNRENSIMKRILFTAWIVAVALLFVACGNKGSTTKNVPTEKAGEVSVKVTFIELGSVSCIPCNKMQPIMKSIETRYAGLVKVVFHDVMKDKAPAEKYRIKLIPTQVFLDASGKEITRHEGFFPEEEIDKILKAQGLSPTH